MRQLAIGDLVEKISSVNPASYFDQEDFSYVDIAAVSQSSKRIENPQTILCDDAPSRARQVLLEGDVLVSTVRPNLNAVACVNSEHDGAIASTGFTVLRPVQDKLDSGYLYHWVRTNTFIADMVSKSTGQSYPAVSDKIVKASTIPLPPLEGQKRIAGILDQADALRRLRARALEKLNTLGQAVFQEMFVSGDINYPVKQLGSVCDVRDGTHDSPKYVDHGHPLLTSKNFSRGVVDYQSAKLISDEDFDKINKRSKVHVGDIVMPMIGTIGSPVLIDIEPDFAIKNVALIKRIDGSPAPIYIQSFLNSNKVKRMFLEKGKGGTQKFISLGDIRSLEIPVPDEDSQQAFSLRVAQINKQRKSLELGVLKIEALFASLQSAAFRGQL